MPPMSDPKTVWGQLKASASLAKGLLLDKVIAKKDITTLLGSGFLEIEVREANKSTERYLILKSRGGDATVFVPLDEPAAKELVHFIEQSFLSRQA